MNKLKVVHLTKQKGGGAGIYAQRLSDGLNSSGNFESVCYFRDDFLIKKQHERTLRYKILRRIINSFSTGVIHSHIAPPIMHMHSVIKEADIIHLHSINDWLDLSLLTKAIKNKKTVWTMHGIWNLTGGCVINGNCYNYNSNCENCPYFRRSIPMSSVIPITLLKYKKKFLSKIDLIIPNSNWSRRIIEESYTKEKCSANTIYPIISKEFYSSPNSNVNHKNQKYVIGLSANSLTDENKNIGKLLQFLNDTGDVFFSKVIFLLAGEGELPLKHTSLNIEYLGPQLDASQMNQFYNSLDLFVSPSLSETFGMTIVEAQFCGIPVVTFDKGALSETFQHKKTGYLVLEEDYHQFIEAMKWCLTNLTKDKELISSYSKNHFCKNKIIEKQEEIYNSLY